MDDVANDAVKGFAPFPVSAKANSLALPPVKVNVNPREARDAQDTLVGF